MQDPTTYMQHPLAGSNVQPSAMCTSMVTGSNQRSVRSSQACSSVGHAGPHAVHALRRLSSQPRDSRPGRHMLSPLMAARNRPASEHAPSSRLTWVQATSKMALWCASQDATGLGPGLFLWKLLGSSLSVSTITSRPSSSAAAR